MLGMPAATAKPCADVLQSLGTPAMSRLYGLQWHAQMRLLRQLPINPNGSDAS